MDAMTAAERFGAAIEENRATILIGAGLSVGAGYPTWSKLLEDLRERLDVPKDVDLTMVAQYAENEGWRADLIREVSQMIGSVDPAATENHHLIAALPIRELWTTNYDTLVERSSANARAIELDEHFLDADARQTLIYKMHGSIRPGESGPVGGPQQLVLSRDDFDEYPTRHPRFAKLLEAHFLTKSFLFLGFSLKDPNFEAALKLARLSTPDRQVEHFALVRPDSSTDPKVFEYWCKDLARAGVHVVELTEYSEVTAFLKILVARTRPDRLFVIGSVPGTGGTGVELDEAGNYPSSSEIPPELRDLAVRLGQELGRQGISISTASGLGAVAGYALLDELGDAYDPDRFWLLRRRKPEDVTPPNRRLGTIIFIGEEPTELRGRAFDQVRAVLVLGGGRGTAGEVERAVAAGMGVVPVGCTGGTAFDLWRSIRGSAETVVLGGRPVDPDVFDILNSSDVSEAVEATVKLVRQAMFFDESGGAA